MAKKSSTKTAEKAEKPSAKKVTDKAAKDAKKPVLKTENKFKQRESQQFREHKIRLHQDLSKEESQQLVGRYFVDESKAPNQSGVIVDTTGLDNLKSQFITVKYCDEKGNWSSSTSEIKAEDFQSIRIL